MHGSLDMQYDHKESEEIGKSRNFDTSICYNKYIGDFGMNVLIVEDDEAITNLLTDYQMNTAMRKCWRSHFHSLTEAARKLQIG